MKLRPRYWTCVPTRRSFGALCLIALLISILGATPGLAAEAMDPEAPPNGPLNEQVIRIPGEDPPAVTLQVTVLRPNGDGPFPLAIMNHGATGVSMGNRGTRYRLTNAAFYFLSRGYAVALPMMRGFAASGGEFYHFGCDLGATATANAKDIRAVIRYLGADPRIDSRRVLVAGQSFGGWSTLGLGAMNIPNVKGLINFNGGIRASDCKAGDSSLVAAASEFGARTKIPSIWFYGENDGLFPPAVWHAMHDRYIGNGGHAELVDIGSFMKDSHQFLAYPESLPLWTPKLDGFLKQIGLPYAMINSGYLPEPFPAGTKFAAVSDVAAVPLVSDKGRDLYRKFLGAPLPRAFVITQGGGIASMNGGFDPLGRALRACHDRVVQCGAYAVDDRVVWKPFLVELRERAYNIAIKGGQATILNFSVRLNPDCSPMAFAKFTQLQPPAHGRMDLGPKDDFPRFPASSPFAVCNKNTVHGVAISYTPGPSFSGDDFLSFLEENPNGQKTIFKLSLAVK